MAFIIMDFMREYQAAVVDLVKDHLTKEFQRQQDRGGSAASYQRMAERKSSVMSWSTQEYPLSHEGDCFALLSFALAESSIESVKGLRWTTPRQITIIQFGQLLYNMGRPHNPAPLSPPVFRKGTLLDRLRVTVQMFICFIGKNLPQNRTLVDIFVAYIRFSCNKLRINFGPWSAGGFPGSGYVRGKKHDCVVVPTIWCGFGKAPDQNSQAPFEMMNNEAALGYQMRMEQNRVISDDTRAPWATNEVLMDDLHIYFKQTINPSDLSLSEAGITEKTSLPIRDIYEWALSAFNIDDPVHHLVLFTAILYAKARPYLSWPEDAKGKAPNLDQFSDHNAQKLGMSRYICQLEWCDGRTDKNPLKEGSPFIPVFVAYFMAYAGGRDGSKSPLQKMKRIPAAWSSKHSMYNLCPSITHICLLLL